MLDPFEGWKQYEEKKKMKPKPIFYVLLFGVFFLVLYILLRILLHCYGNYNTICYSWNSFKLIR